MNKQLTRYDYIKSLDKQELASYLCDLFDIDCEYCPASDKCKLNSNGMVKWLNERM